MKRWPVAALVLVASTLVSISISTPAQTPAVSPTPALAAQPNQRLRGTVQSFDGGILVMTERSGEVLRLALPPPSASTRCCRSP